MSLRRGVSRSSFGELFEAGSRRPPSAEGSAEADLRSLFTTRAASTRSFTMPSTSRSVGWSISRVSPVASPRLHHVARRRADFLSTAPSTRVVYFDDGTNPTLEMTREFIDIADRTISGGGAVAVHCKAGLGRTGTLIGAYLIYKHGFSADEGAWHTLVRARERS